MSAEPKRALSEEGYLALEREAPTKSEYRRGEMVAMAGAKGSHNKIAFNFSVALGRRLGDSCSGYTSDMKVRTGDGGLYYTDVVVSCGQEIYSDPIEDVLLNPVVIVEVLSRSTAAKDASEKLDSFRTIPSLKAYILVAQERVHIDAHVKQGDSWITKSYGSLTDRLELQSLKTEIPLEEIYRRALPKG